MKGHYQQSLKNWINTMVYSLGKVKLEVPNGKVQGGVFNRLQLNSEVNIYK